MSEHYDFHYQPTGSGAISGQQVLEQTEDAINELGDYVYDNVGGAMDVAQEALETAQNAQNDAQTALDTANSFSDAIQSAQQDASTALSTAQTAQTTASNANATAIQAQQDASSAVTTANNASGQVSTLSGTVTALGQRVTTAEGNIGQNTSDITALTTRVGTAEGNITTLQNDVTIAQGNASSAMATAGQVKQQAYVFRYSSTALVASSTNANSLLDNTDNLKVGDKVLDNTGNIYVVTAIDTANSTFTIGTALIDLAQDSDVVHKTGDETIGGEKTFTNNIILQNSNTSGFSRDYFCKSQVAVLSDAESGDSTRFVYADKNNAEICYIRQRKLTNGNTDIGFCIKNIDNDNNSISAEINYILDRNNEPRVSPSISDYISLGGSTFRWKNIYSNLINGLTPSSLSLPVADRNSRIDILGYFTNTTSGGTNEYTPPDNGYIMVTISSSKHAIAGLFTSGRSVIYNQSFSGTATGVIMVLFPVVKGILFILQSYSITGGTISFSNAYFIPCQGNV